MIDLPLHKILPNPPLDFIKNVAGTFYLPTEVVVTEPGIVTPQVGRYYETDHYLRGTDILTYLQLCKLPGFNGTRLETEIFLYEVWADYGSDGHTNYELRGWALVTEKREDPLNLYNELYEFEDYP